MDNIMGNLILPQTEVEYRNALIDAAEVGAEKALIEIGSKSPVIKRTDAERTYTKRTIKILLKAELIELKKPGERNSAAHFDRIQLLTAIRSYYRIINYRKLQQN
jgi:hypothetical protein